VAHGILWRTWPCAIECLISVAHRRVVRHRKRKSYFCGAPVGGAPQIFFYFFFKNGGQI
jgi:hypothetical protein